MIKRLIAGIIFSLLITSTAYAVTPWASGQRFTIRRSALTGGGNNALDGFSGTSANPYSNAQVYHSGGTVYAYRATFTSNTTEDKPLIIVPDDTGVGGVTAWELMAISGNTGEFEILAIENRTVQGADVDNWNKAVSGDTDWSGALPYIDANISSVSTWGYVSGADLTAYTEITSFTGASAFTTESKVTSFIESKVSPFTVGPFCAATVDGYLDDTPYNGGIAGVSLFSFVVPWTGIISAATLYAGPAPNNAGVQVFYVTGSGYPDQAFDQQASGASLFSVNGIKCSSGITAGLTTAETGVTTLTKDDRGFVMFHGLSGATSVSFQMEILRLL